MRNFAITGEMVGEVGGGRRRPASNGGRHAYIPTYLHTYRPTCLHTYIRGQSPYIPTYLHKGAKPLHTYIPTYLHAYIPTPLGEVGEVGGGRRRSAREGGNCKIPQFLSDPALYSCILSGEKACRLTPFYPKKSKQPCL